MPQSQTCVMFANGLDEPLQGMKCHDNPLWSWNHSNDVQWILWDTLTYSHDITRCGTSLLQAILWCVQLLAVNIEITRFTFRLKNEMARVAILVTLRITQQQHQYQPFDTLPEKNTTGWFKWCSFIRLSSTALLARSRAQASIALVRVIRVKVQQAILDSKLASQGFYPEHQPVLVIRARQRANLRV